MYQRIALQTNIYTNTIGFWHSISLKTIVAKSVSKANLIIETLPNALAAIML